MSLWHFLVVRPDVIISTGAGAAFFTLFLARLFRRKVIYIESIARVETISLFGNLAARYADMYLVQWPKLENQHPKAVYCNPFKEAPLADNNQKKEKIFLTVGTVMPFDRMINNTNELKEAGIVTEDIFAQVGESDITPSSMEVSQTLTQETLNKHLAESKIAIVHGGSGSMLGAIRFGCIVIAMPRRADLGEHYDDHQFELVGAFRDMGLVIEARTKEELSDAIEKARSLEPKMIEINPDSYAHHIDKFINR
jgi:UDP-N-acetylglucosamine transferase subunit ALG13